MSKSIGPRIVFGVLLLAAAGLASITLLPDEKPTGSSAPERPLETPDRVMPPPGSGRPIDPSDGQSQEPAAELRVALGGQAPGERVSTNPALEGRLLAPGGRALEGATISWTALLEPDDPLDPASRELDARRRRILAASIHTVTGKDGSFSFAAPPPWIEGRASVVWATHPEIWARAAVIAEGGLEAWGSGELACELGEPIEVLVVDEQGHAVAGATVSHWLQWTGGSYDGTLPQTKAREMFRREYRSDQTGRVLVSAAAQGNVLLAHQGSRVSNMWWGETRERVTLTLGDSFLVSGRVRTDAPDRAVLGGHVVIGLFDALDQSDLVWAGARMNVRPDGSFGPGRFQLATRSFLLASLREAVGIAHARLTREAPRPGEHVVLEIEAKHGVHADVLVIDSRGDPVEGATVQAHFETEGGTMSTAWGAAGTDGAGRTRVEGLPPGRIYLLASKDGYRDAVLGWGTGSPCVVPRAEDEGPFVVQLGEARRITGRVVHEGEPVPSFEIAHWSGSEPPEFTRFDDDEGRFEVTAPSGARVAMFAIAPELPQSEVLELAADAPAEDVELVLPVGGICRGRLVDQMTGEPVSTAELKIIALSGTVHAGFRRDVHRPRPDGSFELPGFVPGRGGLLITAAGYADHYSYVHSDHGAIIEYGLVALEPLARLSVRAEGWSGARYEEFRVSGHIEALRSPRPLEPDGTLLLSGLRPGPCDLYLTTPEQRTYAQTCWISASAVTEVVFRQADGAGSLHVEVESPGSDLPLAGKLLRIHGHSRDGDPLRRQLPLPAHGVHTFEGLPADTFVVEVSDETDQIYATSTQELGPGEHRSVRMKLRRSDRSLRLLVGNGTPLRMAPVQITLPGARGGWWLMRLTDIEGKIAVGAIDSDEVILSYRPDTSSLVLGLSVALEAEGTTDVMVETPATVSLQLRELGEPCTGVKVLFGHGSYPFQLANPSYTTDAAGFARGYDMPEGEYVLALADSPYWKEPYPVTARTSMEPIHLELYSRGSLTLNARDAEGLPLAGVAIQLDHVRFGSGIAGWIASHEVQASSAGLFTGTDGKLQLSGLPRGEYRWRASLPDGSTRSGSVVVPPRGLATVEVR